VFHIVNDEFWERGVPVGGCLVLGYRPCNSTMEPYCLEKVIHDLGCRVSSFHKITDGSCYQLKHSAILFHFFVKGDKSFFFILFF